MEKTSTIFRLLLLTLMVHYAAGISDYYQDEHCGGTLYVSRQTRLRLTQSYPSKTGPYHPQSTGLYQQNEDCQVELIANHGFQLMVFFKSLDISSQDNCTSDWLMVTDGNSTSNLTLTGGKRCGDEFPKDVYTTEGRELTVTFHSNETLQDSGFELIITPFHTDYLDENCNGTLYVSNTGPLLLNLTRHAHYQPSMECQVTITGLEHHRLMVYFRSIDIEHEGDCAYDWVELDDGDTRADAYIAGGELCGSTPPGGVYTTTGKSMTVYFHSDGSVQFQGFNMIITAFHTGSCLSYEHQCDNGRCISSEATCLGYNTCGDRSDCPVPHPPASVSSGKYKYGSDCIEPQPPASMSTGKYKHCSDCTVPHPPASVSTVFLVDRCYRYDRLPVNGQIRLQLTRNSTYPPNLDCFQTFEANYGQRLMVYFRSLNIQSDDTCNYDSLEVDDGISRSSPFLNGRKLCGSSAPIGVYETSGRYLTVYFHSDASEQFPGFDMIITSYHPGSCSSDEFQCDNSSCISNSVMCSGYNPCGDFSDCSSSVTTEPPPTSDFLDENCNGTLHVASYGPLLLNLTRHALYNRTMKCQVTITGEENHRLMVYLSSIDIEHEGTCDYDWVELDNGGTRAAPYMAGGKLCGSTTPSGVYTTTGKSMTVYFQSDGSDQLRGFSMVITAFHTGTCLSYEHHCDNGRCISSAATCLGYNTCGDGSDCPGAHPSAFVPSVFLADRCDRYDRLPVHGQIRLQLTRNSIYPANLTCFHTFEAYYGQRMMLYFRSLNIENEGTCNYDWVELDDGTSKLSPYVNGRKLCGRSAPTGVYETGGRYLTVYFHSDGSEQFSGFDMIITSYHTGTCSSDEFQCANSRCISKSVICSGYNPCGDYSDCSSSLTTYAPPHTSVYYMDRYCGTTLGNIDRNFGVFHLQLTRSQHYRPGMSCRVVLETSPGNHIFIKFLSIDLEQRSGCYYDYVVLYDGTSATNYHIANGRQCGSTPQSGIFTTSGSYLTVYFHSDNSNQGTGFDLLIQPSVTVFMDQHCGGTISIWDDSQIRLKLTSDYHYKSNTQCQLTIETNYDEKMMFYFRDLDTENVCSNDWLEIDDGTSRGNPYLAGGKRCGHTTSTSVYTTSGRHMTLYFESDISVQGRGFDMIITSFRDSWYCNPGEHSCANGRCINASLVCDGYNSCGDYSDCTTRSCKTDEYRCDNGRCIPNAVRCTSLNPCGDYSDCPVTTTTTTTTTTTDYYSYYYDGLSGAAIAGISLGVTLFLIFLFVAICYGARRRAPPPRRVPNIGTVSTVPYAYENPVPIYYAGAPPPYPGTTTTRGYPGTTALYLAPQGTAVSGTVGTIPTISCETTSQGSNSTAFQLQQK